jgi:3-mercaptopyruvate sulfurtransferase SseA
LPWHRGLGQHAATPIFAEPKRFVFYCASGWRSALAARTVQDMGLENVAHVGGGFTAWKENKDPTETPPPRWRARKEECSFLKKRTKKLLSIYSENGAKREAVPPSRLQHSSAAIG